MADSDPSGTRTRPGRVYSKDGSYGCILVYLRAQSSSGHIGPTPRTTVGGRVSHDASREAADDIRDSDDGEVTSRDPSGSKEGARSRLSEWRASLDLSQAPQPF
jgi:hypothetical protein